MTRRVVVLAALVLAVLVAACVTPAWMRASTSSPSVAVVPLTVTGASLAPGAGAGALVVAAAALALAIARRRGQLVALVGLAAGGAVVSASAVSAVPAARAAAVGAALDAVGVGTLTTEPTVSAWPWVVAGLGLLAVALAVAGIASSRRWATPPRRFDGGVAGGTADDGQDGEVVADVPAAQRSSEDDDAGVWDALSRGEDPT